MTLSLFASAVSSSSATVTMPASVASNDLAIVCDYCASNTTPAEVVPSGFTLFGTSLTHNPGGGGTRRVLSYKVLAGSEGGASLTGMTGISTRNKSILVFRSSGAGTWGTPQDIAEHLDDGNPASQTINVGSAPLVAVAYYNVNSGTLSPRDFSPSEDAEVTVAGTVAYAKYKIYNSSPSNITVDMEDEGAGNHLSSFYVAFTDAPTGIDITVVPGAVEIDGAVATVVASDHKNVVVVPGAAELAGATALVSLGTIIIAVPGAAEIAGAVASIAVTTNTLVEVVPGVIELAGANLVVEASENPEPTRASIWGHAIYGVDTIGFGNPLPPFDRHLGKDLLLISHPYDAIEEGADRKTLYVAATTGRSTANDDEPPAQYVPGRLKPFNFGARLFEGVDPLARPGANEGIFSMIDPDDELQPLTTEVWDGTPLTLKRGPRTALFKSFITIGRYRGAGLVRDLDQKQIRLRDNAWALSGELHGETYAGTGAEEGTADITGRLKPWTLGYCFDIEPVLLSPADQIFQWSLSSSRELTAFRHGGVNITIGNDYANYADLAAASIPSGECATCMALSLVRPNLSLEFGVRVDVVGDNDIVNGHEAPLTRASIIRRIVTSRGENVLHDTADLDLRSFKRMDESHGAPVGWHFDQAMSKSDAINRCLAGILGWWRVKPNGRMAIGWIEAPELTPPVVAISSPTNDVGKPRLVATAPPRRGTRITWRWNYAPVADRAALAGVVSDADAAIYIQPTSYAQNLSSTISYVWPTAPLVTIDQAGFRDEADATVEANRQQAIFSVERKRWARDLQIDPFIDLLGVGFQFDDDPLIAGGSSVQICVAVEAAGSSVQTFEFFT